MLIPSGTVLRNEAFVGDEIMSVEAFFPVAMWEHIKNRMVCEARRRLSPGPVPAGTLLSDSPHPPKLKSVFLLSGRSLIFDSLL